MIITEELCRCGAVADRVIAAVAYCEPCIERNLPWLGRRVAIEAATAAGGGLGVQVGRERDDFGPDHADLECSFCAYQWVGMTHEACPACATRMDSGRPARPHTTSDHCSYAAEPHQHHRALELIDWATIHDHGDAIVDGLLIPGRWTAFVAKAKAGKTTLEMFATVEISEGRDPFDGTRREPVAVLYVDGEMGRFDLEQRLHELGHGDPTRLARWHATDLPPRLDTPEGAAALLAAVHDLSASVVVIDGINGTVNGAEKDDTTWRAFYDLTIFPLKREGVAILTGDNLGKDESLGPRGSSVKVDKPDAVIKLSRTDSGAKLTTTHRRTSEYAPEMLLTLRGVDGDEPIIYRRAQSAWPAGTMDAVELLDQLGVPTDHGRTRAREALNGHPIRNDVLAAAIRYRRAHSSSLSMLAEGGL